MNKATLSETLAFIRAASSEELRTIAGHFKDRQNALAYEAKNYLCPGDKVTFKGKYGEVIRGTVLRNLSKNIEVRAEDGRNWRVSPTLLKPVA